MDVLLHLGGLIFSLHAQRELDWSRTLEPFIGGGGQPDLNIEFSWDWDRVRLPSVSMLGRDAIQNYYLEGSHRYCLTRGGPKGYIACAEYDGEFRRILCTINASPFLCPPRLLDSVLRFLPLRAIFQQFQTLFFHAAQIALGDTGILFTAPSGTGKTTQAHLWERYRGAKIICNDRTLVRKSDSRWQTYGYPIDGSEPVCSGEIHTLGAVVLLEQGDGNRVERMKASRALPRLMPQLVIDGWSARARELAMEQLLTLLAEIPVYILSCTPDYEAVSCLERRLVSDGVIQDEYNS